MKKLLSVAAVLSLLSGSAIFAEEVSGFSFENTLGTDIVNIESDESKFAGIYEQMSASLESEKVSASVQARFIFAVNEFDKFYFGYDADEFDWSVAFRPISALELSLNNGYEIPGSHYIVEDDTAGVGNIGSDGFTVGFTGVEGLTIGASIPTGFVTQLNEKGEDSFALKTVFGAYYQNEIFSLGASCYDLALDSFAFGIYGSVTPLEGLAINAGFTSGESLWSSGNVFNLSAGYDFSNMSLAADFETNASENLHLGFSFGIGITDEISAGVTVTLDSLFESEDAAEIYVGPSVEFGIGNLGSISAGVDMTFAGEDFSMAFPVVWIYSL